MADSFQGENRRKHFRHNFESSGCVGVELSSKEPVSFKSNGNGALEFKSEKGLPAEFDSSTRKEPFQGKICNLSLGGMCVRLDDEKVEITEGETLVAHFSLPCGEQALKFNASVIHVQANSDGHYHGFQFVRGENRAENEAQEKQLWKFLSEDQRQKNQLVVDEMRQERAQRKRQVGVLQKLLLCHAVAASAGSKLTAIVLGIVLGLGSAAALAVTLFAGNQQIWQEIKEKQHVTEDGVDIDKQLAQLKVQEEPKETYKERLQRAREKLEQPAKEKREKNEQAYKDFEHKRTAGIMIVFYSGALGLSLFAAVFFPLLWRLPGQIERAQKNLGDKIQAVAKALREETRAWGGEVVLEQPSRVRELISRLEASPESEKTPAA